MWWAGMVDQHTRSDEQFGLAPSPERPAKHAASDKGASGTNTTNVRRPLRAAFWGDHIALSIH